MLFSRFLAFFIVSKITCGMANQITVQTSDELHSALAKASPGDVITLGPKTFHGEFKATRSGTAGAPITVVASTEKSKIVGSGHGTGFTVNADYWNLKYFTVSDFDVGVLVLGTGNVVESLPIHKVHKGVGLRGEKNFVNNCAIKQAKVGIRCAGSRCELSGNSIEDTQLAILIGKKTCCGKILYNVVDNGRVDLHGNGYSLDGNVFKGELNVLGCDNTLGYGEVDSHINMNKNCRNTNMNDGSMFDNVDSDFWG